MKLTNQRLVINVLSMPLAACVVGTTPGDHELTVIALPICCSFRSSS
ncbi:MAG: hypothetical protein ACM3WP_12415 [Acidobacteriota bacterium]